MPGICIAPQYVAEELLKQRGIHRIDMYKSGVQASRDGARVAARSILASTSLRRSIVASGRGRADRCCWAASIPAASSCSATERIHSDQRSEGQDTSACRRWARRRICSSPAWRPIVGLDPQRDINWVIDPDGRANGALRRAARSMPSSAFRRSRKSCGRGKIGHVVVNSAVDRPWSQYFCCMLAGNSDFVAQASGGDQARAARHPEGGAISAPSRARVARSARSMADSPTATTMRCRR